MGCILRLIGMYNHFGAAALCSLMLIGCEGQQFGAREAGALSGAALGAGLGAIVGNQVGDPGAGIAIGSGFGALAGGLIGHGIDQNDQALNEREQRIQAQQRELEENKRILEQLRARGVDARTTDRGVVVNLPDVLFAFDSAQLVGDARATVREISDIVNSSGGRRISVEGHTDSIGSVPYNQRLSEARANSVTSELVRNGVARNRIASRGYGETRPIASNANSSGRQRNRRVEVIIENK